MAEPRDLLQAGDALLLIDVQQDFCPGGALPLAGGDEIVPILNRWIRAAHAKRVPVYASRDWHPATHLSFESQGGPWPAHCIQNTQGAAFHPELELADHVVIVSKGVSAAHEGYSAFQDTGLAQKLEQVGVSRLWIGGLALDVCVRHTVLDACRQGFQVHVIVEATRPLERASGDQALLEMSEAGAWLEVER